jgi:hypothetical protein
VLVPHVSEAHALPRAPAGNKRPPSDSQRLRLPPPTGGGGRCGGGSALCTPASAPDVASAPWPPFGPTYVLVR